MNTDDHAVVSPEGLHSVPTMAKSRSHDSKESVKEALLESIDANRNCEMGLSKATDRIVEAGNVGATTSFEESPLQQRLIQRPTSSGEDPAAGFKYSQPEQRKMDFQGTWRGQAGGQSRRAAQQSHSPSELQENGQEMYQCMYEQ